MVPPGYAEFRNEINKLYAHQHHHHARLSINTNKIRTLLIELLQQIYDAKQMPDKLDEALVNETARLLYDGVEKGYGKRLIELDYDSPDFRMLTSLKNDVWQFSAAKNYQEMKAMTEALQGPDGRLRTLSEFKQAVKPIIDDHVQWLETEYRTAVASSQMAAKWVQIQSQKDIFPLLQFDAILDDRTTELCKSLDGVIRPVDDAFWDQYYPPNHFNCRSDVRQLRDGNITPVDHIAYPELPKMFLTNVAKRGLVFPPESPYYIGTPEHILNNASLYMDESEAFIPIYKGKKGGYVHAHVQVLTKKGDDFDDLYLVSTDLADGGGKVEMLPPIPETETEIRSKILPNVFPNKNPDLRVDGEYYEVKKPKNLTINAISQNIRKASHQAPNVIIILKREINLSILENITKERFKQHANLNKVIFYYQGKFYAFERK